MHPTIEYLKGALIQEGQAVLLAGRLLAAYPGEKGSAGRNAGGAGLVLVGRVVARITLASNEAISTGGELTV
jgi:hypothetical protein